MPDLSSDRHALLEQLKQSDDAAERLLRGKSREQANWQPKQATSWSSGSASIIWRASTESIARLCWLR
jgi:hypothetical protein